VRRVITALVATTGGLALLAGYHTTPAPPVALTSATATSTSTAPPATAPPSGAPPSTEPSTTTTTSTTVVVTTRTVDGPTIETRYGPVQVQVVLAGARIADVKALQLPFDHPRSARISQQAGPWLHDEVIAAQSANIRVISGATYTSIGYSRSLQGALDSAQ
jgi:uncharacterized protein with FMN-binding domain